MANFVLKSTNGLIRFAKKIFVTLLNSVLCITIWSVMHSCAAPNYKRLNKKMDRVVDLDSFSNHQFGILVYDTGGKDTILKRSIDKYFIPASNVKIFTLFTALKFLPEQLPTLQYRQVADTLFFQGVGDPTLLHPEFNDSTALEFLDQFDILYFNSSNFVDDPWPPGWSWEDFDQAYAAEKSSLPLYGNRLTVNPGESTDIFPEYFRDSVQYGLINHYREPQKNTFYLPIVMQDSLEIPLRMRSGLIRELLTLELGKPVEAIDKMPEGGYQVLNGSSRDTVLKKMMIDSDNFLAEQLLLSTSAFISDTLSSEKAIQYMLDHELPYLDQQPRWVDGSGLSRYNLFTPASLVAVLHSMYEEYGEQVTLGFFPVGGISGTLEDHFEGSSDPYVFAKSGTLGNTYCLSGYLRAKSGKILIFSIMNNNFRLRQQKIKTEIQKILEWIRDNN